MTHMQTQYNETDVNLYQESERTSVMAILSMVFGVGGCCLGITSIPAIFLGIFGLVGISKSKGRVGGTGFGIAGILIGLLTLALWGGLLGASVFGLNSFITVFGQPTEQVFLDIQAKNYDSARSQMGSPGSQASDEQFVAFYEGYSGALGEFVSLPDGLGDLMSGYMAVGEQMQAYNGRPGYMPMPMRFDSGWALVVIVIDTQPTGGSAPMANEYIVIDSQGNEYGFPGHAADESIGDGADAQADAEAGVDEAVDDVVDETVEDDGP